MELRRNDVVYFVMSYITRAIARSLHDPKFFGLENLPESGPALILPRHQRYADILLEGIMLTDANRKGTWIMKDGLPKWFELFGGVSIRRAKDVRKIRNRNERKIAVGEARKQNAEVMDYVKFLYENGGVVVMHPEGTRCPQGVGTALKMDYVNQAVELSRSGRMSIPLIPIGINYSGRNVTLNVGQPINHEADNLESVIRGRLISLSNVSP